MRIDNAMLGREIAVKFYRTSAVEYLLDTQKSFIALSDSGVDRGRRTFQWYPN